MAGYLLSASDEGGYVVVGFNCDEKNLSSKLRLANGNRRVMTIQVDCDDLDAVLWGLDNYNKQEGK